MEQNKRHMGYSYIEDLSVHFVLFETYTTTSIVLTIANVERVTYRVRVQKPEVGVLLGWPPGDSRRTFIESLKSSPKLPFS